MTITKKETVLYKRLPPAKFYLEDLYDLHAILTETIPVTLETEDSVLSNVDDISELGKESIRELTFIFQKGGDLSISNHSSISFWHDTLQNRGVINKVEEIFNRRKRNWMIFLESKWNLVTYFIVYISLVIINNIAGSPIYVSTLQYALLMTLFFVGLFSPKRSIIFLQKRIESSSFISRNKDKIIIALISALATAILSLLFSKWLSRLF